MRIALAIGAVREAESDLAGALTAIGERHRAEHDVFHLSRTLARIHRENLEALAPFADRYGADAGLPRPRLAQPGNGSLALLGDLRALYLLYAAASIDWVLLGQGAQAIRDAELLGTVAQCREQTLRGMKWSVTRIKTAAPQILAG